MGTYKIMGLNGKLCWIDADRIDHNDNVISLWAKGIPVFAAGTRSVAWVAIDKIVVESD